MLWWRRGGRSDIVGGGSTLRRARILVVDDDPIVAMSLRRLLASEHDVRAVHSGSDALNALIDDDTFDLILCDISMEGMDGIDLYRQLAEKRPNLIDRIVFLTGGAFTLSSQRFLETIPNPRLEKPIAMSLLREFVRARVG